MTEKEYIQRLKTIIQNIKSGAFEDTEKELKDLYAYKPVRLLWHVAYGELLNAQEKRTEGWRQSESSCWNGLFYAGVEEQRDLQKVIAEKKKNQIEIEKLNYRFANYEQKKLMEKEIEKKFLSYLEAGSLNALEELMQQYYITVENLVFLLIRMKLIKQGAIKEPNKEAWYYKLKNYDYLEEKILHSKEMIILVQDGTNQKECDLLAGILYEFGHPVYILLKPEQMESVAIHSEAVTKICLENQQKYEDAIVIPTIEVLTENDKKENNRADIIRYLLENESNRNFGLILSTGNVLVELLKEPLLQKHIECLSDFDYINSMEKMQFGWVGEYQEYISDIYGFDVKERLQKPAECDFSIVIPARNSAETLYHTLQTCLNQDYEGRYEIIVSDNSTNGNQEVYQVCQDLNDARIKYVKTPRNLPLPKSFEFAFLQAKGEFIFSLGSDDGVCSWALSTLRDILNNNPADEIVQWQRGFYGWKDYNSGQKNELVIPGCYANKKITYKFEENINYFARIFNDSRWMYSLPTLYINSGFRRSYFNKLLQKTGRLWDGNNQDLYMGVMTAAINEKILNIEFPLTIAGMSNNSLGYVVGKPKNLNTTKKELEISQSTFLGDNCGIYILHGIIKDMPLGTGEVFSLYANIFRAIQLGVVPEVWRTEFLDDKKIFSDFFKEHTCLDDSFDKYLHYARYLSEKRGKEFLTWFDETIYKTAIIPRYYVEKKELEKNKKSYKEGITPSGGLIVDASKYGVTNILEAVKLFEELIYWTPETYEEELEKRKVHD